MKGESLDYLTKIAAEYNKKHDLLLKLFLSETDKIHYLKSDNFNRVIGIIKNDDNIISDINHCDYTIARLYQKFTDLTGIKKEDFSLYLDRKKFPVITDISKAKNKIDNKLKEIQALRNDFNHKLSLASLEVKKNIDDLSRQSSLDIDDPLEL